MKTDKRVIKTKRNIRNAFIELVLKKDFERITVTDIARLAEIDRKTFYLHYESTDAILMEFETELANRLSDLLHANTPFNITTFFHDINSILIDNMEFYRRISKAHSYSFFLTRCKNLLKNSWTASFYPTANLSQEQFEIKAEYTASGIIAIYTNWLNSNSSLSLNELAEAAEDVIYHGWEAILRSK